MSISTYGFIASAFGGIYLGIKKKQALWASCYFGATSIINMETKRRGLLLFFFYSVCSVCYATDWRLVAKRSEFVGVMGYTLVSSIYEWCIYSGNVCVCT